MPDAPDVPGALEPVDELGGRRRAHAEPVAQLDRSEGVGGFGEDAERAPAPFTLWRFTSTEVELGGVQLPERAPVLVDIAGINASGEGPDLTFGAGPHYCIGAQLAQLELQAVADVLAADFPDARLAVPYPELRRVDRGMHGSRLVELPVVLRA
ncbi:hypothetical protein [Pseudonocardia sp. DLS-67]